MQNKVLVDDYAVGIAAVGDAAEVLVRGVVGEGPVWAELLQAGLALAAGAIGIDQAADRGEIARPEPGDSGTDPGDTAEDFMARHAGVDRRHDIVPLVTDQVQIGVADAAEQDLDLHVVFGWIAARDCRGCKR